MKHGNGGTVQSAMSCPFIMGMVWFGVAPTPYRLLGIALALCGILLSSCRKGKHGDSASGRWLIPTFAAFAASGMAQSFANLPSYWKECEMSSELRGCLVQLVTIAAFAAGLPFRRDAVLPVS